MVALLLILTLIFGPLLIIRGWAGHRVGDAPCCSKCNFDLSGTYPILDKCPECGAALAAKGSVATGRFERRWRRFGIGLVLVLFACSTVVLQTKGVLSTRYLVQHLGADTLTEWSLRRPHSPIAREGRWELEARIRSGALPAAEQDGVLDALLVATESPKAFADDSFDRLLDAFVETGSATVQRDIARFLIERHADDTQPWTVEWGELLGKLRGRGMVSDEAWDACLTHAFTPEPWILGDRPIRPGEEFALTLRPSGRPIPVDEYIGVEFDLPAGVEVIERIGYAWDEEVWSGSVAYENPVLLLRAPTVEGEFEIAAHWIVDPVTAQSRRRGNSGTETRRLTGGGRLEIRAGERAPSERDELARWLAFHLIPSPRREGGYSSVAGSYFDTTITVAMKGEEFFAEGKLMLIRANGAEDQLCQFSVRKSGLHHSSSLSRPNASSSSRGTGGSRLPTFQVEFPESALNAGEGTRLIIRFDAVTLPDGRTHTGPDPIEIELPPEALVPSLR